jgi:hypothetical protein
MSTKTTYPTDRTMCMSKDGPIDPRFRVPGGTLLYKQERDARFPYIYEIATHTLVHSPEFIKRILIHVVDTSIEARKARAKYELKLLVPLGPDAYMENYGQFPNLYCLSILIHFLLCYHNQVYWNWNPVQYCLPGRLPRMGYILRKMTLRKHGVWMGRHAYHHSMSNIIHNNP